MSDEWTEAHKEFHTALVAACDSPWRLRLRGFLFDQTERYRRLSIPALSQVRDIPAEHRGLMDAVLTRDAERTIQLLATHLQTTATRVLALSEKNGQEIR